MVVVTIKRFNEVVATKATLVFGTMWITYVLFLYGFLPVLFPGAMSVFLYWSNTIQLWSLPLLMVGTNILGRTADSRAQETHDIVMQELVIVKQLLGYEEEEVKHEGN